MDTRKMVEFVESLDMVKDAMKSYLEECGTMIDILDEIDDEEWLNTFTRNFREDISTLTHIFYLMNTVDL